MPLIEKGRNNFKSDVDQDKELHLLARPRISNEPDHLRLTGESPFFWKDSDTFIFRCAYP